MIDTITAAAGPAAGPAAYRVTATRLHADQDPYLALECPGECVDNLLHGTRYRTDADLGTLVMSAVHHERRHAGAQPPEVAKRLREQVDELGEYRVHTDMDVHPFLILDCPYLESAAARRCPDTVDGECLTNLLAKDDGIQGVTLGMLLRLAAEHEAARARALAAELGSRDHAELLGCLAAIRAEWDGRRKEAIRVRETADGRTAGAASVRADLIARVLADLDRIERTFS
jgi:hypothetical protein